MEDIPHILVVDDDNRLRELLRKFLTENDFRVTSSANAAEARNILRSLKFDLLVLDIMMPGESGLELTSVLRETSRVPILLLTAMGESEHRIDGLERGADDYLAKPFEPRELLARIRSILRRVSPQVGKTLIILGKYQYDPLRQQLLGPDGPIKLTNAEARLLQVLVANPGSPISRESLQEKSQLRGSIRAVDVQVTRLRRKIEPNPKMPRYLQTIRGQGYVLWPD
ncbi:MAG: DNA-binding response regulator [Rhodospirillaceae bacterium]|nr:DNA-binding response regulator [Rhodospirillaceae bacterium]|tara:strand:+ start:852 stop:1529 length:678 start_codon:yes stop_codon:yes gene_type:complete